MKKLLTILFFVSILNTLYSQTITTNTIYLWNNGTGLKEMASPATPSLNYGKLFAKTDGHVYWINDGGTEFDLTAGAGGSTISTFGNGLNFSAGTLSLVTQMSITTDASGLKLVGDVTSPGNNKFYKTNSIGVRTWAGIKKADLDDLTIGEVLFGNMAGTGQVEQDPNLYFDGTTDRLSIGDNTPAQPASLFIKGQPAGASYPIYIEDGNAAVHLLSILSNGGGASLWFGSSNATSNLIEIGGQASGSGFTGFLLNHGFGFGATNIWRVGEENATNFVLRHVANGGGFEIEPVAGDVIMPNLAGGGTQMVTVDNAGVLIAAALPAGAYTDEESQDAVGGILVSPLIYSDATPSITLAGLSGLGTANQILGMNAAATAYEYKSFAFGAAGTTPAIVHTANTLTLNFPLAASTVTSGTISNTTQSISGIKTFANAMIINASGSNVFNVGSIAATYRITNGASNTAGHSFFDVDASNSTAGAQGFGFDDGTNGFIFTAANGTRRIMRAYMNLASLDNTAGSEDADLIFGTQAAGAAASEKLRITNTGNVYGTAIHNNATSPTGATNQYLASGTYTPTLTNVTNIAASTAYACQWMRVGNVVTVSGKVDIDVTLGVASELGLSLPLASNFAAEENAGGAGSSAAAASLVTAIRADAANDRAAFVFTAVSVTNDSYFFEFTYVVL